MRKLAHIKSLQFAIKSAAPVCQRSFCYRKIRHLLTPKTLETRWRDRNAFRHLCQRILYAAILLASINTSLADSIPLINQENSTQQIAHQTEKSQSQLPSRSAIQFQSHYPTNRTQTLKSSMQVYLSPHTGRPMPGPSYQSGETMTPPRAQVTTQASPLTVLTSSKENGGKFIITGPHFRSQQRVSIIEGKTIGHCSVGSHGIEHPLSHQH